jgi:hypothetical protein
MRVAIKSGRQRGNASDKEPFGYCHFAYKLIIHNSFTAAPEANLVRLFHLGRKHEWF